MFLTNFVIDIDLLFRLNASELFYIRFFLFLFFIFEFMTNDDNEV